MFIDEVKIHVFSGNGGDGVVHFRREKFVPKGGPDGGDGGRGGNVIFEVKQTLNTLSSFQQNQRFQAKNGMKGKGQNQTGRSAGDLIIHVPPGTLVFDDDSGELIGDLVDTSQQLTVCKGGRGGRGNTRFVNSRNKAPRHAERGEPGEERRVKLELKLIADIGIVGVPNAGKSTFLSVVTNAKPKIADYPFTTIHPNLGVARLDMETSLVLADIPGLIEGAHQGIGLGHAFLRHIQRTRVLIHLLDGLSENPLLDFSQINSELALFDDKLGVKPQIIALNKMDMPQAQEIWPEIRDELTKRGYEVHSISAITKEGVRELLYRARTLLAELPEEEQIDTSLPLYSKETDPNEFEITKVEDGWQITGASIERAAAMTYWEYEQSIRRFQSILETLGIDQALREAGIQNGESVFIGEQELEWQD